MSGDKKKVTFANLPEANVHRKNGSFTRLSQISSQALSDIMFKKNWTTVNRAVDNYSPKPHKLESILPGAPSAELPPPSIHHVRNGDQCARFLALVVWERQAAVRTTSALVCQVR